MVVMNNIKTEGFFCPSQAISSGQPCVLQNYILCRAPHQLLEDTLIGQWSAVRKLLTNQRLVFRQAAGSLYILFESISSWTEVCAEDDTCALVVAAIAGAVGFAGGYLANIVIMGGGKRSFDPSIPIAQNIMQGIFIFLESLNKFFQLIFFFFKGIENFEKNMNRSPIIQ